MKNQYGSNRWLTFRAINRIGAYVNKGEKATPVVYFKISEIEDRETKEKKHIPTMKLYRVFNLEQTTINNASLHENEIIKAHTAEQIRENFLDKPELIQHPQPHYNPI